jgi:rubredoxin
MKILQKGHLKKTDDRPWWLRCKHTCSRCHTVYQLEEADAVDVITARTPNGPSTATSSCPVCGMAVITNRATAVMIVYRESEVE